MKKFIFIFLLYLVVFTGVAYAQDKASGSSAKIQTINEPNVEDIRAKVLSDYLKTHNSPLVPYAPTFVKYADMYNLDWKLVAAISGLESTFGQQIPYGTYNGWGWGIYGDNMHWFASWEDGIKTVSQGLRENYMNKWGASNVYEIGRLYAASPTWALRVDYLMRNIDDYKLRDPQGALPLEL